MITLIALRLLLCIFFVVGVSSATDTISANQSLSGAQTLVSVDGNFEMGFFRPGNSSNYYIGIWYKKVTTTPPTIVWVANRETPISDGFSSELKIIDGNLVLLDESNNQTWSTNMSFTTRPAFVVLRDDGNLVLRHGSSSSPPIWQSFDHPTHTFLPGGKLGYDKRTNTNQVLTSWRNVEDPGMGLYSLELDHIGKQFLIKWNRSVEYWTSGSWNDRHKQFSLLPEMRLDYIFNYSYVDNENESYFTYSLYNPSIISRFIIDVSGHSNQLSWLDATQQWNLFWSQPRRICEVYARCGAYSICNEQQLPFCNCLTTYKPRLLSDWNRGDSSGGCVRETEFNCSLKNSVFILTYVKTRSLSTFLENGAQQLQLDESACKRSCLSYCSCFAYTYISDKCLHWNSVNLNNVSLLLSQDPYLNKFYIKVSSPDHHKTNTKVLVAGIVSGCVGLLFLCSIGVIFYKRIISRDRGVLSEEDRKGLDVPFFEFKKILSATENFSLANKLGQGGFGPVYKGTFPGGIEMAVKRLSSQSKQGLKEFKNEVLLIAKLQHRNLVRLLGYNMKDREMILLYEYMPNKSLDSFIFDKTRCIHLDWALRFDIIIGIARGLLYLHQDSRLRVIHRDLKAGNVLLDAEMNPKISDFGLAKIVKGRDTEATTTRVIGTYGYMAPEYALNGFFSVKSDVFSFGVIVLEIISGKRNTGYYLNQQAFSLVSYAWGLWKDKKPLDLLDQTLAESCNSIEVLRCMIVGLLCVQEDPQDRPTMTGVLGMLGMDIESLPDPKEPAFISKARSHSSPSVGVLQPSYVSESEINQVTVTEQEGR